ncbi:hypothetical protein [Polynucleobacter difficilis]|jgi:hypothetical protein|uniref:hypothetical protein n=1 Tax=Polynucleobacter difficilis TaxID=556054 RepID=UPI000D3D2228|nr:hypothetical protein [Polynucleobacter difficilis]
MFRPPPDYHWRNSKNKYEKQFRRKAPQWTLTLDRNSARTLYLACCRIGFKLHPEVLTLGELFSGRESVWDDKPCYRLDGAARPPGRVGSKK